MNKDQRSKKASAVNKTLVVGGLALLLALLAGLVINSLIPKTPVPEMISLTTLARDLMTGEITKIEETVASGELTIFYEDDIVRTSLLEPSTSLLEQLDILGVSARQLDQVQIEVVKAPASLTSTPLGSLLVVGLLVLPIGAVYVVRNQPKFGRGGFKTSDIPATRFADVAGLDENIEEMQDIVKFLRDPSKYTAMGASMPKGALMIGEPGTGKTLVARAMAGEAGVPFFATSGSEFVEMYVGVGASRIRSLFRKARKKAPCIVFIDEIDAVGRARRRAEGGAEAEQDQTLNQLLVEMDGFDGTEGIIVLAATNRVDILDSALTRAGRFDRRIYVGRPDVKGREAILAIHTKGKNLAEDVSLAYLAKATPGLVGADLANLVNEGAITAVRRNHGAIQRSDFEEALEKVIAGGVARKSSVMGEEERRIVAYHEAGHAVVMQETKPDDPVYKITIIPRGEMGGFTMTLPEKDQSLVSRRKLLGHITGLLGGRAAEEIFFQDVTNGASNDLKVATQVAEDMVMRLGMDARSGLRVFNQSQDAAGGLASSQKRFETIDLAVQDILDTCYVEARRILTEKRAYVDAVAGELLEVESISKERFAEIMDTQPEFLSNLRRAGHGEIVDLELA